MIESPLRSSEKIILVFIRCAMYCMVLSILAGAVAALYYIPGLALKMKTLGMSLQQLRPLHTSFAAAWIFLGAVACIYKYLFAEYGEPTASEKNAIKLQLVCWAFAGIGILVTLPFGFTSGREYIGFLPVFSLAILVGWIVFAVLFFKKVFPGFWAKPVYVYMWSVGMLYFIYTFTESHAYLLPFVKSHPVIDLQIQWKSCGTLVASFNQMVYGALFYISEKMTRDKRIAQSKLAFSFFGIGLLNSFTNYTHHTYHLPQMHLVKWIGFSVSMLEIILLVKVFQDVTSLMAQKGKSSISSDVAKRFINLSKCWNLCLLTLAILISVPPLNALIHGTHLVMAHAMGSMLAIDSYILLAVFAVLLTEIFPKREVIENHIASARVKRVVTRLNISLILLVSLLAAAGISVGITRIQNINPPAWLAHFPFLFVVFGFAVAFYLFQIMLQWHPILLRPLLYRRYE